MRKLVACSVAALALTAASIASASDNAECYTSPGVWNVPRGALVVNRGGGDGDPIKTVIDTMGEHFTHSVVSHGQDSAGTVWGSMDTMKVPATYPSGNSSCGHPVEPSQLANGGPGARTDNGGGLWSYYFSSTSSNSPGWTTPNAGNSVKNTTNTGGSGLTYNTTGGWSWGLNGQQDIRFIAAGTGYAYNNGASSSYGTDNQVAACLTDWEKNSMAGCSNDCLTPGYGYSVYAYMSLSLGGSNTGGGYGTMCSGLISKSFYWGTQANGSYCTPNAINQYTYSNAVVVAAANNLYNAVQNQSQGFFGTIGACIACFDCNLLDEAGDQVVNCFTNPQGTSCTQADHNWAGNNVGGKTATTISPARLAGDYGHASTTPANNSPWAPYGYQTVYFNQPGNIYGCWY